MWVLMFHQAFSQALIVARIGIMRYTSTREAVATVAGFTAFTYHTGPIEAHMPLETESTKAEMYRRHVGSIMDTAD
jgi:hypothetical protein